MYSAKFGFATGYNLVFTAFQPSGTGRGIEDQPLYEVGQKGYYRAEPATDLENGDIVLAYELENVYWENDIVYYVIDDYVFYENEQVYYEGELVRDLDSTINDVVTWTGDVVGSGEYKPEISASEIDTKVDTLIVEALRVTNVYDETTKPSTVTVIKNL